MALLGGREPQDADIGITVERRYRCECFGQHRTRRVVAEPVRVPVQNGVVEFGGSRVPRRELDVGDMGRVFRVGKELHPGAVPER